MKKVITVLLVCVLCVSLFCACGKKEDDTNTPVESKIPDEVVIPETTLMDPDDGKIEESSDPSPDTTLKPDNTMVPDNTTEPTETPSEALEPEDATKD